MGPIIKLIYSFVLLAMAVSGTPITSELEERSQVDDRPPFCPPRAVKIGDGNPHQNSLEIQVTDNLQCGAGTTGCGITKLYSHTLSWTLNFGSSLLKPASVWTSGGFSVSEAYTTGQSFTCNAAPGQTVCVWSHVAYTAYTVRTITPHGCLSSDEGPDVMLSPNANGVGSYFYCVAGGACRSNGQRYWVKTGRAGGP